MKRYLKKTYSVLLVFGFDALKFFRSLRGLPVYFSNFRSFIGQQRTTARKFGKVSIYPCLDDRYSESGSVRGHYFHQDLLVARRIHGNHPARHVDIGSRVDGFVAHVAAFREMEVIDIRRMDVNIPNVSFIQCDVMGELPKSLVGAFDSLSCLHALEHFGLGRYGDPVRYDGHVVGFNNMDKLLKQGGKMYLSVPIGPQRIEYDAHRVFSVRYLLDLVSERFKVESFSYVNDAGDLIENAPLADLNVDDNFECTYGCGIFELSKR